MTVLTPNAMTALRNKRNRSCVERAIHDLLLRAWNGDKGYVEVTRVRVINLDFVLDGLALLVTKVDIT